MKTVPSNAYLLDISFVKPKLHSFSPPCLFKLSWPNPPDGKAETLQNVHNLRSHVTTFYQGLLSLSRLTVPKKALGSRLATQILSKSVAIALEESGDEEVLGTAKFCQMMNDFFDCTNVRSTTEYVRKRKLPHQAIQQL